MESFLGGPIPDGAEVLHLNGDPLDCRIENLFLQLPGEPPMLTRITRPPLQCAWCRSEFYPRRAETPEDGTPRWRKFCCRRCFDLARGVPTTVSQSPPPPDPDRWRLWPREVAWAARMIPASDPGPGRPGIFPAIDVPEPPDHDPEPDTIYPRQPPQEKKKRGWPKGRPRKGYVKGTGFKPAAT